MEVLAMDEPWLAAPIAAAKPTFDTTIVRLASKHALSNI
jgi:hypothetical protein